MTDKTEKMIKQTDTTKDNNIITIFTHIMLYLICIPITYLILGYIFLLFNSVMMFNDGDNYFLIVLVVNIITETTIYNGISKIYNYIKQISKNKVE